MAKSFSPTPEQHDAFAQSGALRLNGLFGPEQIAPLASAVWADLERRYGVRRDRSETWTVERPAQFQHLVRSGAFDSTTETALSVASAFGDGADWASSAMQQLPLVTFPTEGWDVPSKSWHFDVAPGDCTGPLPVFRMFVFLEDVMPGGGGPCYVEGSHRLAVDIARRAPSRLHSRDVRIALAREDCWFRDLFAPGEDRVRRFMGEAREIRGTAVRVCEMTGQSGDVYVMHPALCHTAAPNGLDRPRIMLTITLARRT